MVDLLEAMVHTGLLSLTMACQAPDAFSKRTSMNAIGFRVFSRGQARNRPKAALRTDTRAVLRSQIFPMITFRNTHRRHPHD